MQRKLREGMAQSLADHGWDALRSLNSPGSILYYEKLYGVVDGGGTDPGPGGSTRGGKGFRVRV